jgi:hypothetical protein
MAALLPAGALVAAEDPPVDPQPTVQELQQQIEALSAQLEALQKQLETLSKAQAAEQQAAELEQLRQAAAAEAARDATPEAAETGTQFASGTRMQPQLNPELSVTGDIFLLGGDHLKTEMQPRHFELDLQAYLDPFTKMHVVFGYEGAHSIWGYTDEEHDHEGHDADEGEEHDADDVHAHDDAGGFALEEGYITWLQLPGNTALTIGRKRQQFGSLNRWHMHALPQSDYPWVIQESFGTHGLAGTGVSLEWMMPQLWADSNELVVEIMNGDNDVAFAGADWKRPTALVFFKNYWDLSPDTYLELDLTAMRGATHHEGDLWHDYLAVDFVYDWYPTGRELYRGFQMRGMLLRSWLELEEGDSLDTWGGYLYGQYKFARNWIAGLRWDWVEDQRVAGQEYWGLSPYLTFWQSEFVRLRGQYSYRNHNIFGSDNRYELQFTFAAGPHKHEEY